MKIKYLAISLLTTVLVSSPLMANDKDEDIHMPLVVTRAVDKATPAAAPDTDVTDVVSESNTRGPGGGATGQARGHVIGGGKPGHTRSRGDVIMDDISVVKELDKSSQVSSPRDAASGMATGKRQHSTLDPDSDNDGLTDEACDTVDDDCDTDTSEVGADDSETRSSKGYIKLGDIKGESQRATEGHGGAIAGIVVGVALAEGSSDDDASDDCDDIEADDTKGQTEVCVDGHVTVLK